MAYLQRRKVHGTFLELHVRSQIRTLWCALGWLVTAIVFAATTILAPLPLILLFVTYLWVGYRIVAAGVRSDVANLSSLRSRFSSERGLAEPPSASRGMRPTTLALRRPLSRRGVRECA